MLLLGNACAKRQARRLEIIFLQLKVIKLEENSLSCKSVGRDYKKAKFALQRRLKVVQCKKISQPSQVRNFAK